VAVQLSEHTVISLLEDPKEIEKEKALLSDKSDLALRLIRKARDITI